MTGANSPTERPRFSVVIVTFQRDDALERALAPLAIIMGARNDAELVLIDNNCDAVDRSGALRAFSRATYCKISENSGVAGGRNAGIRSAKGDILVFFDDDAVVETPALLEIAGQAFVDNPAVGILAFHSCGKDGQTLRSDFPHADKARMGETEPFRTYRFTGVGHAIRRGLFDAIGAYRPEFFYALEEAELALRAMEAGYEIQYLPSVVLRHLRSSAGRMDEARVAEHYLLNKLRINYLHLPVRPAVISGAAWLALTVWRSRGRARLLHVARAFKTWRDANTDQRRPIGGRALQYIRRTGGALWR